RMRGARVLEVVLVHVGVHRYPGGPQLLMILRSRQRRQEEEFQQIERQFALDDLDIADDTFQRIIGKTEDIYRVGETANLLPVQQHLAILGDAVLLLFRRQKVVGIDVLQPDEHPAYAGTRRFLDEAGDFVAQRVDLDDEMESLALVLAQRDQPVENRLPVAV